MNRLRARQPLPPLAASCAALLVASALSVRAPAWAAAKAYLDPAGFVPVVAR